MLVLLVLPGENRSPVRRRCRGPARQLDSPSITLPLMISRRMLDAFYVTRDHHCLHRTAGLRLVGDFAAVARAGKTPDNRRSACRSTPRTGTRFHQRLSWVTESIGAPEISLTARDRAQLRQWSIWASPDADLAAEHGGHRL